MAARKSAHPRSAAPPSAQDVVIDSELVRQRLAELHPLLQSVMKGDYSTGVTLPATQDAFTELFQGVQRMQQVINQQVEELRQLNRSLAAKVDDRTRALEEAQALTHLGSWEWSIADDTIAWSDELYRIYGMRPQERAIGFEEFIGLIHPEDRDRVQGVIGAAFKTGEPFEFEHRIVLPTGDERFLKGMGKMIKDADGTPIRMLGTSQDITQAKQLDRAKDEFISLVSHQLRTPLAVIRIHGNMLEDGIAGTLEPQQEQHVRAMTSSSIRLIELVDDILRISRVSLDRIRINAEPSDPNKLIQACVEEALPIATSKGAQVTFVPDESLGLVAIDHTIFDEILRNLVSNAVRYAKDAGGEIEIRFTKKAQEYVLTVRDNGIGIPQADQAYVFERFYRAHNATAVDTDGSGLGLYVVKLFTEAAGGKITLKSVEGEGTTFSVTFPCHGMAPKVAVAA